MTQNINPKYVTMNDADNTAEIQLKDFAVSVSSKDLKNPQPVLKRVQMWMETIANAAAKKGDKAEKKEDTRFLETKERISELFKVDAPAEATVKIRKQAKQEYDKNYYFKVNTLKKLLLWLEDDAPNRNIFISGDAGTGKTAVLYEVASRLGYKVNMRSCSGRTRFSDLIGTLLIDENGKTVFQDGPLTDAYRNGGVFIANEITRMDAGEQMMLVDILDKRSTLIIAETGEVIKPHVDFRFAATGNSNGFGDEKGAYAGEKRGSNAFLDRFWKIQLEPLTQDEELSLLKRYFDFGPKTDMILKSMIQLAVETRKIFIGNGGELQACIETRALFAWASLIVPYTKMFKNSSADGSGTQDAILMALEDAFLNGIPMADREAIMGFYSKFINKPK